MHQRIEQRYFIAPTSSDGDPAAIPEPSCAPE
jgi:hypothetical protein